MNIDLKNNETNNSYKKSRNDFAKQLLAKKNKKERMELYALMQRGGEKGEYEEYITATKKYQIEKADLEGAKDKILDLVAGEKSRADNASSSFLYDYFFDFEDEKKLKKLNMSNEKYKSIYENEKNFVYKKLQIPLNIWKDALAGETLIDLGCGGPQSTGDMYRLALRFGAKKYIGVDKYPETDDNDTYGGGYKKASESNFRYWRKKEKKTKIFPRAEVVKCDMLSFLSLRTATANFVMNSIDYTILEKSKYIDELIKNINRLTLPGNVVFGVNNTFLYRLENHGFKLIYGEKGRNVQLQIRQKIDTKA